VSRTAEKGRGWPGPIPLLGLLIVGAAALTFWETRGQSLYADEVTIFSSYRGWDPGVLLRPDGGHLILTTLLVYKTLWQIFGAESYLPLRILHVVLASISAGLFYQLARTRIGDYPALAPTALVVLFGSAGEIVATPFGSLAYGSVIFGLAALLALERGGRRGDVIACICLIGALASYSISIAFLVGAAVLVYLRGPAMRRRSAWVIAAPVLLYAAYRIYALHYGGHGETNISLDNVGNLPSAMLTELAAAAAALSGLFRVPGQQGLSFDISWGYPIGIALVGLVAFRLRDRAPVSARLWALLATLLAFWGLIALNLGPLRAPDASRYVYIAGLLMLLVLIELLAEARLARLELAGIAVLLAGSILANVVALHETAPQYRTAGRILRGDLAGVEIAGRNADPNLPILELPDEPVVRDLQIPVHDYLAAAADLGSPAYSPDELAAAPETPRAAADAQMIRLLGLHTAAESALPPPPATPPVATEAVRGGTVTVRAGCVVLEPTGPGANLVLRLPPGGVSLRVAPGASASVALRRFADAFAAPLAPVAGGTSAVVAIPRDRVARPWEASITADQKVEACPVPA
jgi:hypothetical protein